jgi:branched-chain amino acid transport system permease protein
MKLRLLLARPEVKRLVSCLVGVALIELMTGPSGSSTSPTAGISGSYAERFSFFGLFQTVRCVTFLFVALVIFGLWTLWLTWGRRWRGALTSASVAGAASPVDVGRGRTMLVGFARAIVKFRTMTRLRQVRMVFLLALLAFATVLPHIETDPFWQAAMVEQIEVFVLLALGLNVVVGFAGLLDLGFVAFYAIGAYTTAWVTGALPTAAPFGIHLNPFFAIPIAIAIVMVAGVVLGAPTLRLRGDYLAIVTLGFGEIITIFANNLYGITGGSEGTNQIPHFSIHLGPINYAWGLGPVPYYYLTLVFVVLFIVAFSLLEHSRVGRAWTAIREDEVAAESIGINPLKYKVMAFAIGAASAGFAGVMTAGQTFFVNPSSFVLPVSILILVLVIFGGMGSIAGVVLGAIVIQGVTLYLIHSAPGWYQSSDQLIYIGALLVVMMIFRPAGLLPSRRRKREIGMAEAGEGHMDELLTGDTP